MIGMQFHVINQKMINIWKKCNFMNFGKYYRELNMNHTFKIYREP
jgi:hypothetical protein